VNPWILVWLIVAIVTTMALIAFAIALGRHVTILGRTVGRFRDEVQPIAEEIAEGSRRASQEAASFQVERRPGRRSRR